MDDEPKSPAEMKEIRLNRKIAQDAEGIKAMAVAAAKDAGLANTAHIAGGIDAWKKAGGPVLRG